jgi:hypothetical protein
VTTPGISQDRSCVSTAAWPCEKTKKRLYKPSPAGKIPAKAGRVVLTQDLGNHIGSPAK